MNHKKALLIGSQLIQLVAVVHVVIAVVGGDLYIFFGAGEEFAEMDNNGSLKPMMITFGLSVLFFQLGFYGLSGAGYLKKLPFVKVVLYLIALVFTARGLLFFYEVYLLYTGAIYPIRFPIFSFYSLATGACFWFGVLNLKYIPSSDYHKKLGKIGG